MCIRDSTLTVKRTSRAFELSFQTDGMVWVPCDRCLDDIDVYKRQHPMGVKTLYICLSLMLLLLTLNAFQWLTTVNKLVHACELVCLHMIACLLYTS